MSLFSWKVDASSYSEVALFKKTLVKRVIKNYGPIISKALYLNLENLLETVSANTFIHPQFATFAMVNVKDFFVDLAQMEKSLNELISLSQKPAGLCFFPERHPETSDFNWVEFSLNKQGQQLEKDLGEDPMLRVGNELSAQAEDMTLEAKDLLKVVWPEAAKLTDEIVSCMVWFSSANYWSSTDPATFGAVYTNPKSNWTMPFFFETLLHEGGHLHLMIKETFRPLYYNPLDLTSSPLRSDPRPVKGVFHAAFVLARMSEGLFRLADSGTRHADEAFKMATLNVQRLEGGLLSLEKVAQFTPEGQELMDSLRMAHTDFRKYVGTPNELCV